MKIAIGAVFYRFGGVAQHAYGIKKYSSHKVDVVPCNLIGTILEKYPSAYAASLYKSFVKKVRIGRYDIVHSQPETWFINLCHASRSAESVWVHTYHTLYFEEDNPDGLEPYEKEMNQCLLEVASEADVKISVSKWLHEYLLKNHSLRTEVVPNGVDLDFCNAAVPARFTSRYGVRDFILYVGYLDPVKNPALFIDLATKMPSLKFAMIGRNLDAVQLERRYKIRLPTNLVLLKEMTHLEMIDAMSACKVYVMTSKREGFPTSLLEAMGLGKAVVVPDHTGCREVVGTDKCGFMFCPDSIDDLVEKTKQALLSEDVGERAKERVSQNFDWRIVAQKLDKIYESSACIL